MSAKKLFKPIMDIFSSSMLMQPASTRYTDILLCLKLGVHTYYTCERLYFIGGCLHCSERRPLAALLQFGAIGEPLVLLILTTPSAGRPTRPAGHHAGVGSTPSGVPPGPRPCCPGYFAHPFAKEHG